MIPESATSALRGTIRMPLRAGLMTAVKAPLWSLSVLTGAKSFVGNPVIGSERLNRLGLHEARMRTAGRMARHRRRGAGPPGERGRPAGF